MSDKVRIFDTTLRDGEQSPGIALSADEKLEIAQQLARLGVDIIEAGFPASSQGELDAVSRIADTVKGPVIAALCRTHPDDIERAWEAISNSENPRLHVFISTSAVHMESMLRMSRTEVLEATRESVRRARQHTSDVEFSPQDATRTDTEFLVEVVREAVSAGATTINIPDTVGYALPAEFGAMIGRIRQEVPDHVVISVHCHDDLGLAVSNSLAGILNGARQVEVAVNGIGERAGNCSLEEIVMVLTTRAQSINLSHGLNLKEIARTSRLVSMLTGYPIQPNKAVVGANAFAHESGIHQHGVLMNRENYEIMDPKQVGYEGSKIVLGKHSGRHAFVDAITNLGLQVGPQTVNRAFTRFKELADRKVSLTDADLIAIVSEELGERQQDAFELESLAVAGGTHLSPTATVRLRRGSQMLEGSAMGDGMIDAAYAAIAKATGTTASLKSFNVSAVTSGSDALGDVVLQLEIEGRAVTGRGVGADVVEASARAYLAAINRAVMSSPTARAKVEVP